MTQLNFELLRWQKEVFNSPSRFKIVAAGRRCGKSRLSAITLLIEGLNCPEGAAVMYIAPTLGQARAIIWDLIHDLGRQVIKSSHINNLEITLINGRKIMVRGADNPDSLRGMSLTYVVLDEVAFIKQDIWEKVIRASLSDRKGRALFISTPSGRNWFYDIYKLGMEETDEEWRSWHYTTKDNETIDPKEIDAAERTLSSFAFKQEYLSSFDNAGSDVFKEAWFKTAPEPKSGSYVVAIDLAGFEDVAKNAGAAK
jgi:phage FluMu gp28-like protein